MGRIAPQKAEKIYRMSQKLEDHLDEEYCDIIKNEETYSSVKVGLFYDFMSSPLRINGKDALTLGMNNDAIYSIVAGKHALWFSHEGRVWKCMRK